MKTQITIITVAILLSFGIALADFTDTGKQGVAYSAAEDLKDAFQAKMNRIVAFGTRVDTLKARINTQLGAVEAGRFQTAYIDAMKTQLSDVSTAWSAAR